LTHQTHPSLDHPGCPSFCLDRERPPLSPTDYRLY
jgi:hypothetical protein